MSWLNDSASNFPNFNIAKSFLEEWPLLTQALKMKKILVSLFWCLPDGKSWEWIVPPPTTRSCQTLPETNLIIQTFYESWVNRCFKKKKIGCRLQKETKIQTRTPPSCCTPPQCPGQWSLSPPWRGQGRALGPAGGLPPPWKVGVKVGVEAGIEH